MIDNQIVSATCELRCGNDSGTGWLVTSTKVITARHCVIDAINDGTEISLVFHSNSGSKTFNAKVFAEDESLDVCILLIEQEIEFTPIVLSEKMPIEGSEFTAFGFPVVKFDLGHRLNGSISQIFDTLRLVVDIDLHVDTPAALTDYRGLSGAALICNGQCQGMLRLAVDNSLGAVSIAKMVSFLQEHSVPITKTIQNELSDQVLAPRENFTNTFDLLINQVSNGYAFIEGAHGIGKSTFCKNYTPLNPALEHFDTYSFSSLDKAINAMHLAQPEVLFNWFNTLITSHLSGKPARISTNTYPELIIELEHLLEILGQSYLSENKIGVVFVDGIDEVMKLGDGIFKKFIGLLPSNMPAGLVLVFSAPNFRSLSTSLGNRVKNNSSITIPALTQSVARNFCMNVLSEVRSSAETVRIICDIAQGHPLYLRYLIDLANEGASDEQITSLPLINGSIRNYYEALWNQLNIDSEVVNLLAIIARLRWGISTQQLADMLNDAERAVLITTLTRIQHLLLNSYETTIYHSSFNDFLIEKTELRDSDVQQRLAQYCMANPNNHYGTLNSIYHGLRTGGAEETNAIAICRQDWVDRCVTLGVKPDILLIDVIETLDAAIQHGDLVEVIRLLLLSQRIGFRYDTLFAQSASLTADALIALDKTQEALQHMVRYDRLIVPILEALPLALQLINKNEIKSATKLLDNIEIGLDKYISQEMSIEKYLTHFELRVYCIKMRELAGDNSATDALINFYVNSVETIKENISDVDISRYCSFEMASCLGAITMCLLDRYLPVSFIKEKSQNSIESENLIEILLVLLRRYRALCQHFGMAYNKIILDAAFNDLQILIEKVGYKNDSVELEIVDDIITLGAPTDIVLSLVGNTFKPIDSLQFVAEDNVSIDKNLLFTGMLQYKLASFLNEKLPCPDFINTNPLDWHSKINQICKILSWCDGAARRTKNKKDVVGLQAIWTLLVKNVFDQLRFTLAQRVMWQDSYAIPETIFPYIYDYLTNLMIDVYPDNLDYILNFIDEQFSNQCGLYSEGFRETLAIVLDRISRLSTDTSIEDQSYALLSRWENFVRVNVKNRHELVPELLTLIPLFTRLDASEEAHRIYQYTLAVSMGPSWYKEDQLSLMTEAMKNIPQDEPLETGVLSKVAGLLEAASGEMTFQRYVRYDKADFIDVLCSRGNYSNAIDYFLRQTCGTNEQLLAEVTEGEIDRISPLRGTRFPGGALDEQEVVYRILDSAIPSVNWSLCWTLLEVYQVGDERHLSNYAELYARLLEQMITDSNVQKMMIHRLRIICESELEDSQRDSFLSSLRDNLSSELLDLVEKQFDMPPHVEKSIKVSSIDSNKIKEKTNKSEGDSGKESTIRDAVSMPGVFGTLDSGRESNELLLQAKRHLARNNKLAAQTKALAALESLQRGGWSIWNNLSPEAKSGENILIDSADSCEAVVKLYGSLILNEKHAEKWRQANHLIERISGLANQDQRAAMVRLVVEHIEIIVGNAKPHEYKFLEKAQTVDVSDSLIHLLLNAVDHPKWQRREKAASMILWLLKNNPQYVPIVGPYAFTMHDGNLPDVLCGVLDNLSFSSAKKLWESLAPSINIEDIQNNCRHVGRRAVLIRIVDRAAKKDSISAATTLEYLKSQTYQSVESVEISNTSGATCPSWAVIAKDKWLELETMGLATTELAERATTVIEDICSPLPIETSIELEQLLSEGFRESDNHPLGRWMAKVRFALQVALFPVVTKETLPCIENLFRPYNPTLIDRLRIIGFNSPSSDWLTALFKMQGSIKPINGDHHYLDFCERVWFGSRWEHIRLTAFFYNANTAPTPPSELSTFASTQPLISSHATARESCVGVEAYPAFFGSFTPAVPSQALLEMTGAKGWDLTRAYWQYGRLSEHEGTEHEHEGCYLSIKNTALNRLPPNIRLAWVIKVDGIEHAILTT